jgi:hypothetical protein
MTNFICDFSTVEGRHKILGDPTPRFILSIKDADYKYDGRSYKLKITMNKQSESKEGDTFDLVYFPYITGQAEYEPSYRLVYKFPKTGSKGSEGNEDVILRPVELYYKPPHDGSVLTKGEELVWSHIYKKDTPE